MVNKNRHRYAKDKKSICSGFGECEDCFWYHLEEGCNVERDSKVCLLNKKFKKRCI